MKLFFHACLFFAMSARAMDGEKPNQNMPIKDIIQRLCEPDYLIYTDFTSRGQPRPTMVPNPKALTKEERALLLQLLGDPFLNSNNLTLPVPEKLGLFLLSSDVHKF